MIGPGGVGHRVQQAVLVTFAPRVDDELRHLDVGGAEIRIGAGAECRKPSDNHVLPVRPDAALTFDGHQHAEGRHGWAGDGVGPRLGGGVDIESLRCTAGERVGQPVPALNLGDLTGF